MRKLIILVLTILVVINIFPQTDIDENLIYISFDYVDSLDFLFLLNDDNNIILNNIKSITIVRKLDSTESELILYFWDNDFDKILNNRDELYFYIKNEIVSILYVAKKYDRHIQLTGLKYNNIVFAKFLFRYNLLTKEDILNINNFGNDPESIALYFFSLIFLKSNTWIDIVDILEFDKDVMIFSEIEIESIFLFDCRKIAKNTFVLMISLHTENKLKNTYCNLIINKKNNEFKIIDYALYKVTDNGDYDY